MKIGAIWFIRQSIIYRQITTIFVRMLGFQWCYPIILWWAASRRTTVRHIASTHFSLGMWRGVRHWGCPTWGGGNWKYWIRPTRWCLLCQRPHVPTESGSCSRNWITIWLCRYCRWRCNVEDCDFSLVCMIVTSLDGMSRSPCWYSSRLAWSPGFYLQQKPLIYHPMTDIHIQHAWMLDVSFI